jgi:hypothetical protein
MKLALALVAMTLIALLLAHVSYRPDEPHPAMSAQDQKILCHALGRADCDRGVVH